MAKKYGFGVAAAAAAAGAAPAAPPEVDGCSPMLKKLLVSSSVNGIQQLMPELMTGIQTQFKNEL
jgi:hypothetical protein